MSAVLQHAKMGPISKQVATLIFGGQLVEPNTQVAGTTDFTVKPCAANSVHVLGVSGKDAAPVATQTGAANAYGEPAIDISVLDDYTSVYYDTDIFVWYAGAVVEGTLLVAGANGTVLTYGAGTFDQIVGRCTVQGGVTAGMCINQIGGQGAASYFLGRARIF